MLAYRLFSEVSSITVEETSQNSLQINIDSLTYTIISTVYLFTVKNNAFTSNLNIPGNCLGKILHFFSKGQSTLLNYLKGICHLQF